MKILRGNAAQTLKNLWAAGETKSRVFAMNVRDQAAIDRCLFIADARQELVDNEIDSDMIGKVVAEINSRNFNQISAEIFSDLPKAKKSSASATKRTAKPDSEA